MSLLHSLMIKLSRLGHRHIGGIDGPTIQGYVPVGAVCWYDGDPANLPADWKVADNTSGTTGDYRNQFLGGASVDGEVNTSVGNDTKSVPAHTHGVGTLALASVSHSHSGTTGGSNAHVNKSHGAAGHLVAATSHTHSVTWGSLSHGHTVGGNSANEGSASVENRPPYLALHPIQRISVPAPAGVGVPRSLASLLWALLMRHDHSGEPVGAVPVGAVFGWVGGALPSGVVHCDGVSAPDLRGLYVVGVGSGYVLGATGGVETNNIAHDHGSSYTGADSGGHTHTLTLGTGASHNTQGEAYEYCAYYTHTHTATDGTGGSHTHTLTGRLASGGLTTLENKPLSRQINLVKRVS